MSASSSDEPLGSTSIDLKAGAVDEREIAERAKNGDRSAAEELVRRHHDSVCRLLWRFVRTKADLDDLVQETFLRMLRGLPNWKAEQPFNHWLLRIATNTGRDYFRRQSVRRRYAADPVINDDGESLAPDAVDSAPDPAARAAASEAKAMLENLSPDDRTILTLYHLEGWSLVKIAEQFGWSVTATKLRAWRARRALRSQLKNADTL